MGVASSGTSGVQRTRLLIVGGEDVHRRIDLLRSLPNRFAITVAGSNRELRGPFREAGFDYYHYPSRRGVSPFTDLASVFRLFRLTRRVRPHIVHTFGTKPSVWGRVAARLAGAPVVVGTIPGLGSLYVSAAGPWRRSLRAVYGVLQWICCRISDATIFQNADDAIEFERRGIVPSTKAETMPGSGVRTEEFDASRVPSSATTRIRKELGAGNDSVVITMVSRLIRSKGVLEFARAAKVLSADRAEVIFLLVGPDDQQSVDRLSPDELAMVADSVRWLGEREDVREILAASDIAVLPSFYREGIPRVLLEAAAMALPIVTTRSPGCREVVQDGVNGILVEARSPAALARAIESLVRDPSMRAQFGAASRALCVRDFDLSVIADHTVSLYARLLKPSGEANAPQGEHPGKAADASSLPVSR